jgi:hypothetical protein
MSQTKSIALAALLAIGAGGHLANAATPSPAQANAPAQPREYAQVNGMGGELSLVPAQESAPKSQDADPWAVTSRSGVHIPSRSGFVGYR